MTLPQQFASPSSSSVSGDSSDPPGPSLSASSPGLSGSSLSAPTLSFCGIQPSVRLYSYPFQLLRMLLLCLLLLLIPTLLISTSETRLPKHLLTLKRQTKSSGFILRLSKTMTIYNFPLTLVRVLQPYG